MIYQAYHRPLYSLYYHRCLDITKTKTIKIAIDPKQFNIEFFLQSER